MLSLWRRLQIISNRQATLVIAHLGDTIANSKHRLEILSTEALLLHSEADRLDWISESKE
jgi:hypothetical protein